MNAAREIKVAYPGIIKGRRHVGFKILFKHIHGTLKRFKVTFLSHRARKNKGALQRHLHTRHGKQIVVIFTVTMRRNQHRIRRGTLLPNQTTNQRFPNCCNFWDAVPGVQAGYNDMMVRPGVTPWVFWRCYRG